MTAEANIVTTLEAATAVKALITRGDSPATYRVYAWPLRQNETLPAITYFRLTTLRSISVANTDGGLDTSVQQIDCWATTYTGAQALATAVQDAMIGASLFSASLEDQQVLTEDDLREGRNRPTYRVSCDFIVQQQDS